MLHSYSFITWIISFCSLYATVKVIVFDCRYFYSVFIIIVIIIIIGKGKFSRCALNLLVITIGFIIIIVVSIGVRRIRSVVCCIRGAASARPAP